MFVVVPESGALLSASCGREFGECLHMNYDAELLKHPDKSCTESRLFGDSSGCLWEECVLSREERNARTVVKTEICHHSPFPLRFSRIRVPS